jgi:hypothetical protein
MAEVPAKLEEMLNNSASPFPISAIFVLEKCGNAPEGFNRKV